MDHKKFNNSTWNTIMGIEHRTTEPTSHKQQLPTDSKRNKRSEFIEQLLFIIVGSAIVCAIILGIGYVHDKAPTVLAKTVNQVEKSVDDFNAYRNSLKEIP